MGIGAVAVEDDGPAVGAIDVEAAAEAEVEADAAGAGAEGADLGVGAASQFLKGFWRRASDSLGWCEGANTSSWPGRGA